MDVIAPEKVEDSAIFVGIFRLWQCGVVADGDINNNIRLIVHYLEALLDS